MNKSKITLRVENVTKQFGDFTAVENLSFEINSGRVFGFFRSKWGG